MQIPKSTDTLFVESWVHDFSAYHLRWYEQAFTILKELLSNKTLPENIRDKFELNNYNCLLKTILKGTPKQSYQMALTG